LRPPFASSKFSRSYGISGPPYNTSVHNPDGILIGLFVFLQGSQLWQTETPFTRYNLLSNWFDNRNCIVYTNIQPVVKPVWQPVWQMGCIAYTAGCQTWLYNPVGRTVAVRSTRLSNRLYRVNGV